MANDDIFVSMAVFDALGPLDGLRVIDLGTRIAAPFCAGLLGEQGAEVIKVEQPRGGDFMREIVDMTQHIVAQAKNHESDTIPGDFATLSVPCPKCGGFVERMTLGGRGTHFCANCQL